MYNLDVADCDTFFVHNVGVLLHNADKNQHGETRRHQNGDLNKENALTKTLTIKPGEPKKPEKGKKVTPENKKEKDKEERIHPEFIAFIKKYK